MNQQKPSPLLGRRDDGALKVHSIFATIQGEGPFAGAPAVFVRLAGCNLQCPLCDTEYTGGKVMSPAAVVKEVTELSPAPDVLPYGHAYLPYRRPLVVITGGEPFRQDISRLARLLIRTEYTIQVETNGAAPMPEQLVPSIGRTEHFTVVVSPKAPKVHPSIRYVSAYKYVIGADDELADDNLPVEALGLRLPKGLKIARPPDAYNGRIFIHPADHGHPEMNARALHRVTELVLKSPDPRWRLGTQLHKVIGVA